MALVNLPLDDSINPQDANLNISAYRVLYILLLLIQYRSLSSVELNGFLYDNPLIHRVYNAETLTKYINTLREVGCRIPRSSSRNDYSYELLQNPFPIPLEPDEHEVLRKLSALLARQGDEALAEGYEELMRKLAWSLDVPMALADHPAKAHATPGDGLALGANMEPPRLEGNLVRTYRKYCRDMFVLALTLAPEGHRATELTLEPYEVVTHHGRAMLLGVDLRTREQQMVPLKDILSVRQLPTKNRYQARHINVVFALYGRLAGNYRLYPGEKIILRAEDRIHVKARVMETSGLLNRLMKYGPACQVLSPVSLRETMRDRLSRLLSVYVSTE